MLPSLLRPSLLRTATATTGSILAGAEANVAITFTPPFSPGSTVVVTAMVVLDEAGESLRVRRVRTVSTTGCTVNVVNNALLSKTGTVHVLAVAT